MFNLIRQLSRRHRLTILAFYETAHELRHAQALAPHCEELQLVFRSQNFHPGDPFSVDPPEITYEFYNPKMRELVEKHLRTNRFDVMQCEYLQTAHFAGLHPRLPAVLTNHEVSTLAYERRFRAAPTFTLAKVKSMIRWMRMLNYETKLLPRFSAVVVLTPAEREFLSRLIPGLHLYDHPMGVDCEFFKPTGEQPQPESVVFVGNFRHSPNVSGVLWFIDEVWPRLRARLPHAKFVVVGDHAPDSLQRHHGHNNVCMTGLAADVRSYLQQSCVAVAPIFAGAGARTKVLEAWAMERSVVGTSLAFEGLGASPELSFGSDDPDAFAERVYQLLVDRQLAKSLGQKARQMVMRTFSWESFAAFYERIYSKIAILSQGQDRSSQVPELRMSGG